MSFRHVLEYHPRSTKFCSYIRAGQIFCQESEGKYFRIHKPNGDTKNITQITIKKGKIQKLNLGLQGQSPNCPAHCKCFCVLWDIGCWSKPTC